MAVPARLSGLRNLSACALVARRCPSTTPVTRVDGPTRVNNVPALEFSQPARRAFLPCARELFGSLSGLRSCDIARPRRFATFSHFRRSAHPAPRGGVAITGRPLGVPSPGVKEEGLSGAPRTCGYPHLHPRGSCQARQSAKDAGDDIRQSSLVARSASLAISLYGQQLKLPLFTSRSEPPHQLLIHGRAQRVVELSACLAKQLKQHTLAPQGPRSRIHDFSSLVARSALLSHRPRNRGARPPLFARSGRWRVPCPGSPPMVARSALFAAPNRWL